MSNGVWIGGRGLIPFAKHRKARIKREKKGAAVLRATELYRKSAQTMRANIEECTVRNQDGWDQAKMSPGHFG
jgi:hypothetical protein